MLHVCTVEDLLETWIPDDEPDVDDREAFAAAERLEAIFAVKAPTMSK